MSVALLPPVNRPKGRWVKGELPVGARPWTKGQSGNPSGRGGKFVQAQLIAREHSPQAMQTMVDLLGDDDPRVRGFAAKEVMSQAWGPPQVYDPSTEQPDNPAIDPSQFTPAQRKQLRRMLEMLLKAMPAEQPENDGTIDGTAVAVSDDTK